MRTPPLTEEETAETAIKEDANRGREDEHLGQANGNGQHNADDDDDEDLVNCSEPTDGLGWKVARLTEEDSNEPVNATDS